MIFRIRRIMIVKAGVVNVLRKVASTERNCFSMMILMEVVRMNNNLWFVVFMLLIGAIMVGASALDELFNEYLIRREDGDSERNESK